MPTVPTTIRDHASVVERLPQFHTMLLGMLMKIDGWANNEMPHNVSSGQALTELQMTEANVLLDLKNFLGGLVVEVIADAGKQPYPEATLPGGTATVSEPWFIQPASTTAPPQPPVTTVIIGPCQLPGDIMPKPVAAAIRLQRDPALADLLEILVKALLGGQFDRQYDGPKLRKAFNTFVEGLEVKI